MLPVYHSYLLRLWQDSQNQYGAPSWRAMLEHPQTGERIGFGSLEALCVHLHDLQCQHLNHTNETLQGGQHDDG
jgi:hypothetical protein